VLETGACGGRAESEDAARRRVMCRRSCECARIEGTQDVSNGLLNGGRSRCVPRRASSAAFEGAAARVAEPRSRVARVVLAFLDGDRRDLRSTSPASCLRARRTGDASKTRSASLRRTLIALDNRRIGTPAAYLSRAKASAAGDNVTTLSSCARLPRPVAGVGLLEGARTPSGVVRRLKSKSREARARAADAGWSGAEVRRGPVLTQRRAGSVSGGKGVFDGRVEESRTLGGEASAGSLSESRIRRRDGQDRRALALAGCRAVVEFGGADPSPDRFAAARRTATLESTTRLGTDFTAALRSRRCFVVSPRRGCRRSCSPAAGRSRLRLRAARSSVAFALDAAVQARRAAASRSPASARQRSC